MIQKVIKKTSLQDHNKTSIQDDLAYWRSRPPEERIAAVEFLRRQFHGNTTRLQRSARVVQRAKSGISDRCLIVGGYAPAFHGAPRYTGDIDILVKPAAKNAEKIIDALGAFGFGSLGLTAEDFTNPDNVVQLGVPPVRIDIIPSISDISREEAERGGVAGRYGDVGVKYIGLNEFIKNKRASGRQKDLADLEALRIE